jgi:hypothetical protein
LSVPEAASLLGVALSETETGTGTKTKTEQKPRPEGARQRTGILAKRAVASTMRWPWCKNSQAASGTTEAAMAGSLVGRHFLKLLDFTPDEIRYLLDLSARLKADRKVGRRGR